MEPFNLSQADKDAIRKQHDEATKKINDRKEELKKGLQPKKQADPKGQEKTT